MLRKVVALKFHVEHVETSGCLYEMAKQNTFQIERIQSGRILAVLSTEFVTPQLFREI